MFENNQRNTNNLPPVPGDMSGNLPPNMNNQPSRGMINLTRNQKNMNQGSMIQNTQGMQGGMAQQRDMNQNVQGVQNRMYQNDTGQRVDINKNVQQNSPNMGMNPNMPNGTPINRQPMNQGNMPNNGMNGMPNNGRHIAWTVKNAIGTRKNIEIIDTFKDNGIKVDVMEYQKLLSPKNAAQAMNLTFMQRENVKVRQLAIYVDNNAVQLQAGAMSYFQGPLEMISGVTLGNAIGRMFAGSVTGEAMAKPVYSGSGLIVSEPSFRHFFGLMLRPGESVIVDKGMFYMASNTVKVEPALQDNMSSALFGKEGWFQLRLTGPGLAVCECAVCKDEIDIIELNNDILRVDGNFAILRTAGIQFTVEKSAKTLVGSAASGEGLVNVYKGTGQVWLAPTIKVYNMI